MNDADAPLRPPPSRLGRDEFVARYGGVYEHSPWIAERTWRRGLSAADDTVGGLGAALARTLADAGRESKLALIRAHPDLAGRAALRGELTDESRGEQAGAGLDQCSADEYRRFQTLNDAYRKKFGFPFVMAVRGRGREEILAAFEQRLRNTPEREFDRALDEIDAIARLRLTGLAAGG